MIGILQIFFTRINTDMSFKATVTDTGRVRSPSLVLDSNPRSFDRSRRYDTITYHPFSRYSLRTKVTFCLCLTKYRRLTFTTDGRGFGLVKCQTFL